MSRSPPPISSTPALVAAVKLPRFLDGFSVLPAGREMRWSLGSHTDILSKEHWAGTITISLWRDHLVRLSRTASARLWRTERVRTAGPRHICQVAKELKEIKKGTAVLADPPSQVPGYKGDTVTRVVYHLLGHAPELLGTEDSVPASTEETPVKQEWLQGAVATMAGRTMTSTEVGVFRDELFGKLRRRGYEMPKALALADLLVCSAQLQAA